MATIFKRKKNGKPSRFYSGTYWDSQARKHVRKSLRTSDRSAAELRLGDMQRRAARVEAGMVDPFEAHKRRPLAEHLTEWRDNLTAKGNTKQHAELSYARAKRVLEDCGFNRWTDLSASAVESCLADLRKGGLSIASSNYYAQAVGAFARWMVRDRRVSENPLAHLQRGNVKTDPRHARRDLSVDELTALLDAARSGADRFKMAGPDRAMLYQLAVESGLRASELRTLT